MNHKLIQRMQQISHSTNSGPIQKIGPTTLKGVLDYVLNHFTPSTTPSSGNSKLKIPLGQLVRYGNGLIISSSSRDKKSLSRLLASMAKVGAILNKEQYDKRRQG